MLGKTMDRIKTDRSYSLREGEIAQLPVVSLGSRAAEEIHIDRVDSSSAYRDLYKEKYIYYAIVYKKCIIYRKEREDVGER